MEKQEWIERFTSRFCKVSEHPKRVGLMAAKASWPEREGDESPEQAADTEYSYWIEDSGSFR